MTLTSSLISLTTLMSGLSELGGFKDHILRASREILLAIQDLLEVAEQSLVDQVSGSGRQQAIQGVIRYAHKTIRTITRELPRGDEEAYRTLHRKVMDSILEVIENEIQKNSRRSSHSQKAKMKVEVFEAIRNVFLREMYDRETRTIRSETHDQSAQAGSNH